MEYEVVYAESAENDLNAIYEYISYELFVPQTAQKLVAKIMKEINDLGFMPFSYKRYQKEPWLSRGLRYFAVDNYLVFYIPDDERKRVTILRIMYGGRDIDKQLERVHTKSLQFKSKHAIIPSLTVSRSAKAINPHNDAVRQKRN